MKIILFGATGMVGQCVLIECIKSPEIKEILIVGRKSCDIKNSKIKEIIHNNYLDYSSIENQLKTYDACFYCLGVSSVGMSKEKYFDWILYPMLKTFIPKTVITSEELGKAMVNSMFQKEKARIIENKEIKNLAYVQTVDR